jgi:hypothetical protein
MMSRRDASRAVNGGVWSRRRRSDMLPRIRLPMLSAQSATMHHDA